MKYRVVELWNDGQLSYQLVFESAIKGLLIQSPFPPVRDREHALEVADRRNRNLKD